MLFRSNLNDELKSIIVTTSGGDSDNLVGTKKVVTIEGKQYDSYDYVMDVTSPDFSDEQKVDIFVQTVDMFAKVVGGRGNIADPTADATDKWIAKDQYLDGTELTTYVIKSRSADGAGIRSSLLNIYKRTPNTKLTSLKASYKFGGMETVKESQYDSNDGKYHVWIPDNIDKFDITATAEATQIGRASCRERV